MGARPARAVVAALLLAGCPGPSSPDAPRLASAPARAGSIQTPVTPPSLLDPSAPWPSSPGWHRIATVPEVARRAEAMVASRTERRIAVADAGGRRVVLVQEGRPPRTIALPDDAVISSLALPPGELQVLDANARTLLTVRDADSELDAPTITSSPLADGRIRLEARFDGGFERLDTLLRPDLGDPSLRGIAAAGGRRVRATMHEAGPSLVTSRAGAPRSLAFVTALPLVTEAVLLGMDPPGPTEESGWLAVWTGAAGTPGRRLHVVRVDLMGRVLQTTPAPEGFAPSPFDLRAAVLGARDLALVVPGGAEGAAVWIFVAGPDGERLRVAPVRAP